MRETETVPTQDDATAVARKAVPRPLSLSDYPESDGKPMAETPIHWHATVDAAQSLHDFYRDRADVYVGSDMMMYYREGDIRAWRVAGRLRGDRCAEAAGAACVADLGRGEAG